MAGEPQGADAVAANATHAPAVAAPCVKVLLAGLSVKFCFELVRLRHLEIGIWTHALNRD